MGRFFILLSYSSVRIEALNTATHTSNEMVCMCVSVKQIIFLAALVLSTRSANPSAHESSSLVAMRPGIYLFDEDKTIIIL